MAFSQFTAPALSNTASTADRGSTFKIFDGLLYEGRPDFAPLGLVPIIGTGDLWRAGVSHQVVDEVRVRSVLEALARSDGYFYFDIENWPLRSVSIEEQQNTIAKLIRMLDIGHATAPDLHIGFYGVLPDITYWPLLRHDREYDEWRAADQALDVVANHVDAVFPSLYTFYDDLDGWMNYARQTLIEARRYGKPVYPFLWPEFHDSNALLRGRHIPSEFWRSELELCAALASGVVLWGGWKQAWNDDAEWWQEVVAFCGAHGYLHASRSP